MKKLIYIMMFLCFGFQISFSAGMKKVAQSGMQFLKIGAGARATALGEAYVAVGEDVNSIFWNPAGLAYVKNTQVNFSYTDWIVDIKHFSFAAATSFGDYGTLGISFITMDYGDIYETAVDFDASNEFGYTGGKRFGGNKIDVNEYCFGIAYSKHFTDKFSMGGQVKYVYQNLGSSLIVKSGDTRIKENSVDAIAFDFGTYYYTGIEDFRIGMSIQNFSKDIKYERESFQLPLNFRVGLAMNVLTLFDIVEYHKFTLSVEAIHPRDYTERIHLGGEYSFAEGFYLRGGYKFNYDEESFTAGVGLISESGMVIDYSYSDFGNNFASIHRFSLGLMLTK